MFLLREAKLKTFFLLIILTALTYSQSSFTVEWESPAGTFFYGLGQWERNNSVPEIILRDASYNIKVYDGASKQLKYQYADPDSADFDNGSMNSDGLVYFGTTIDVNNDGINEVRKIKFNQTGSWSTLLKIIDGATGSVLFQNTYPGFIYVTPLDIDGDSYIELLLYSYTQANGFFDHLWILSTTSHPIAVDPESKTAAKYNLGQNYPNPFNPTTTISYSISKDANVKMNMYNEIGELLGTYINEKQTAGEHKFVYDGTNVASGVYFYQLIVDDQPQTKKMVIIK